MTYDELYELLKFVKYQDWKFHLGMDGDRMFLQVRFNAIDNDTGKMELQCCRKWMLSPYMTKSEIVGTAWKAVQTAIEHEAREQFTYKGRRVFGPHIDIDILWVASAATDVRESHED